MQGYVSAANIALLEGDSKHVDLSTLDESKVLNLVAGFCKANPDKKPVTAIDDLIRKSAKVKAKLEESGFHRLEQVTRAALVRRQSSQVCWFPPRERVRGGAIPQHRLVAEPLPILITRLQEGSMKPFDHAI